MLEKSKVKELYIKGYTATEIGKILSSNKKTVEKCVERNFKEFKSEHSIKLYERRDCKKAIERTNNQFIGNAQLVKWNRHSYITNDSGTLIFDKSRGQAPGDLPTRYKVIY
ncbi:MAG: hypothetical protein RSA57_03650 [Cetobacterium sp.]|uniref:hypothetical protein n=1 Tax=Bacteria TaxID=2 RepID=UPI002FCC8E0E